MNSSIILFAGERCKQTFAPKIYKITIKAIIFDVDGMPIDSNDFHAQGVAEGVGGERF
ncbi:MAG: hypothetical protein LH472_10355 [Pyrinomonadaceae bacterium]|nr:hypothetical protein [Pyrinomonadaceae bacterium]